MRKLFAVTSIVLLSACSNSPSTSTVKEQVIAEYADDKEFIKILILRK